MELLTISRRQFLVAAGTTGFAALLGCKHDNQSNPFVDLSPVDTPADGEEPEDNRTQGVAFRLSTRGKRASRASKAHASNKLFATAEAADAGRAHPGDTSSIVQLDLSEAEWLFYFAAGASVVDLRQCKNSNLQIAKKLWDQKYTFLVSELPDHDLMSRMLALRLTDAAGSHIDKTWVTLPSIDSTGEYSASVSLPCGTPVPFVFYVQFYPVIPCTPDIATRDRLESLSVPVIAKVGQDGKIFGSITPLQVALALKNMGEDVERKRISVPLIKTVGVYDVTITMHCNLVATVQISVIGE